MPAMTPKLTICSIEFQERPVRFRMPFAATPPSEAGAFLHAHPDLYEQSDGKVRLAIHGGAIAIGSLAQPGFACGVDPEKIGRPSAGNHHLQKELSA